MRVLVLGGTGYVGRHVAVALREAGHDVSVASRRLKSPPWRGVRTVPADLRDPASLGAALKGQEALVHAVGLIRNRRLKGQTFERVVAEGTKNLMAACKDVGIQRFVLVSANGTRVDGTSYQRTKWHAEEAVRGSGIPATIFRPSIVYGADDDFTNKFRKLMRLGAVPYFGRGDYMLAPVKAEDLARAVARSLEVPSSIGKTYDVCGPERVSYREMLRIIKGASGSHALLLPVPKFAIRLAARLLGWIPWFPANNDMLTMLFEGNVCPETAWASMFGIKPTPFSQGVRDYLGKRRS
jgi:uncharacterized protein YbjT (DUF2867 family)